MAAPTSSTRLATHGFTLVEVLVALMIMAIMATLGWQGIDGMTRARDISQEASERTLRLSAVLAQWEQDLRSLVDVDGVVPPLGCEGATLRLARRAPGGVQMVAWSVRGGQLLRWASPVVTRGAELQQAWMQSQQLLAGQDGQLAMIDGASGWQLYFFRGNGWSNCGSSDDVAPAAAPAPALPGSAVAPRAQLPTGVRMVLTLPQGALTRDMALGPQKP